MPTVKKRRSSSSNGSAARIVGQSVVIFIGPVEYPAREDYLPFGNEPIGGGASIQFHSLWVGQEAKAADRLPGDTLQRYLDTIMCCDFLHLNLLSH